jgi:hypothetical protein
MEYDPGTMTSKVLAQILTDYGNCKREDDRYLVPADVEASVYISIGIDGLTVDRVSSFVLETDAVALLTTRGERFVFTFDDLRGVRFFGAQRQTGY